MAVGFVFLQKWSLECCLLRSRGWICRSFYFSWICFGFSKRTSPAITNHNCCAVVWRDLDQLGLELHLPHLHCQLCRSFPHNLFLNIFNHDESFMLDYRINNFVCERNGEAIDRRYDSKITGNSIKLQRKFEKSRWPDLWNYRMEQRPKWITLITVFGRIWCDFCMFVPQLVNIVFKHDRVCRVTLCDFCNFDENFLLLLDGKQVSSRIEDLSAVIYGMNWDFMTGKQRNDLKLVLLMTQNMKHSMEFSDPSTWKLSWR